MVLPDAQHKEAVLAFHAWRHSPEAQLPGTGGPDLETTSSFVPRLNLQKYFEEPHRLEHLLDAVLEDHERSAVDANYVREHYLQSFAILVCIGEGGLIHHFQQYETLRDQKLPHRTLPDDFPITTPHKFEQFKNAQWQFCPKILEYNMNSRFKEEDILPIIRKEKIGEGGSAIIYRIVVEESYNSLRPRGDIVPDRRLQYKNTFVLKTYRNADAEENHKAERGAYMNLRWAGKPSPHIIAYYGSFIHGKSYNIILEYADQGTLEDFMKTTDSPSTFEDTILFWHRLSNITHAIMTIHGTMTGNDRSASQILNGWHQDVKPANILVFSGNSSSPYDCHFKIADLGLSHFKPTMSQATDPSDLDAFGTRAYGAPETFRSHKDIDSTPLPVTQDVDVWSLGCVFSETSVWAHYGWKRVAEYRRRRSQEIEDKGGDKGEHVFHFDGNLLDAVNSIHQDILGKHLVIGYVTRSALDRLVVDMLQHETRPSAKFIFEKSKRLIKDAELKFGVSVAGLVETTNGELVDSTKSSPHVSRKNRRSRADQELPPRELLPPHSDSAQSSSSASQSSTHRHHHKSTSQGSRHFPGKHRRSRVDKEIPLGEPPPPDSDSEQSSSSQSSTHRHHHKSTSQSSRPQSIGPIESSQSGGQVLNVEPSPIIPPSTATKVQESSPQQPMQSAQEEPERPNLSIDQGHEWKRKKKAGEFASLHGEENLTSLDQRDHIFLIDNSATMKQYTRQVQRVIELLAYMVKKSDKDGLDIYFTQSVKKVNSQKSSKLSTSIQQEHFRGITDMRGRLQTLCQEHIKKFGTLITPSRSLFGRQPASQQQRPLSFYILTDAKWQPTDVGAFIKKDLVQSMIAKGCPKEHVAIQFIRFGNDQASIDKLDELDHGLGLKALGMDVVDHTYWNDNVWKLLLGALNDWYDNDPP